MEKKRMEFDSERWVNNVYVILKKKKISIVDFQKKLKLGNGYLSRIKKGKLKPSAEKFIVICYECGFNMNLMIEEDFSEYHDSIYIINESLNKLIEQVESDDWYRDFGDDIPLQNDKDFINLLYQTRTLEDGSAYESYNSVAFPKVICSTDKPAYSLFLPENRTLTLISFDIGEATYYELITMGSASVSPVCSSIDKLYAEKLKKLYKLISQKFKNCSVTKETINMLKNFLQS